MSGPLRPCRTARASAPRVLAPAASFPSRPFHHHHGPPRQASGCGAIGSSRAVMLSTLAGPAAIAGIPALAPA